MVEYCDVMDVVYYLCMVEDAYNNKEDAQSTFSMDFEVDYSACSEKNRRVRGMCLFCK